MYGLSPEYFANSIYLASVLIAINFLKCRPSQLSSSLRRQVWSAVKRLDTISPKLLIVFDAHLGWCSSEIFKVVTNIFNPTQDRTRYILTSVTMLLPTELRHLHVLCHIVDSFTETLAKQTLNRS